MGDTERNEGDMQIKTVEFNRGKYYVDSDTEVYIYFHLGPIRYTLGAKSSPGALPNPHEIIKNALPILIRELQPQYPRLVSQTNGIIILGKRRIEKKEPIRGGEDHITIQEEGGAEVLLCRWTAADGNKRKTLEDPKMFGNIF